MLRFVVFEASQYTVYVPGIQYRHRILTAVLIVVCGVVHPALAVDPQKTYAEGTDHLYSLDFFQAEEAFRSLTKAYPDNPDYWNALASSYWLKILYDQQKLNIESFSGKDRFGTLDSKDTVSEAAEQQLRDTIDKALAAAEK